MKAGCRGGTPAQSATKVGSASSHPLSSAAPWFLHYGRADDLAPSSMTKLMLCHAQPSSTACQGLDALDQMIRAHHSYHVGCAIVKCSDACFAQYGQNAHKLRLAESRCAMSVSSKGSAGTQACCSLVRTAASRCAALNLRRASA